MQHRRDILQDFTRYFSCLNKTIILTGWSNIKMGQLEKLNNKLLTVQCESFIAISSKSLFNITDTDHLLN